jgi:hypothetical protein
MRKPCTEFLKSSDPDKRAKLIDDPARQRRLCAELLQLLGRYSPPEKPDDRWRPEPACLLRLSNWLKDSLRDNKPYDQMVRDAVTADGKTL